MNMTSANDERQFKQASYSAEEHSSSAYISVMVETKFCFELTASNVIRMCGHFCYFRDVD